jgi:type II secretory pathway pseudopilin PulG
VRRRHSGFTYLGLLIMVAVMGAGAAATGQLWSHARQREKEAELLWIGNEFRQAILYYYESTPGFQKQFPRRLEDLVADKRFPGVKRHLRRVYADPMTGEADWQLIPAPDGGVMGVRSRSEAEVIKVGNFSRRDAALEAASRYSDWAFYYSPGLNMAPAGIRGGRS